MLMNPLNGVVWSRCPKNMNYGAKAVQCAEATSALQFYEAAVSIEKVMTKLSIPCGECTKKSFSAKSERSAFVKPNPVSKRKRRRDLLRDQSVIRIVWKNRELKVAHQPWQLRALKLFGCWSLFSNQSESIFSS